MNRNEWMVVMDNKYFNVLELDKIIDMLSKKASSDLGRRLINELVPMNDYEQVKNALEETTEAQSILIKRGHVPLQGIHDIVNYAKRAELGAVLDAASLLKVCDTMRASRVISNILSKNIRVETFGNEETAKIEEK